MPSTTTAPLAAPLAALPALLRDEPAMLGTMGRAQVTFAVPEPARAIVVASIATLSQRSPVVVAVPTTADADRLAADLASYLGPDEVDVFPAWETLPFERVSPSVETMGRRMRAMWHLRDPQRCPSVLVAPARALVQRLGPHVEDVEPIVVVPGAIIDHADLVASLVAAGYRREYQVEHRGEVAVRGSIVDVFPSTADGPIRIDLWGDEVERLATFSVADQRSEDDVDRVEIFPCRELMCTEEVRERAEALVESEPWGADQWRRLADGESFDGMESWLPWLTEGEHVLFDLVGSDAQVVLVEPRRMRDRAGEIIAEEVDLARTLSGTWGASADGLLPRLHLDFDRLLTHTTASTWTMTTAPEGPGIETVAAAAWHQATGDGGRLVNQLRELSSDGYRIVVAAEGAGSAERLERLLREHGVAYPVVAAGGHVARRAGRAHHRRADSPRVHPAEGQAGGAERERRHGSPSNPPGGAALQTPGAGLLRRPDRRQLRGAPAPRRRPLRRHGQTQHRWRRAGLPAVGVPR